MSTPEIFATGYELFGLVPRNFSGGVAATVVFRVAHT
jgi:hypothetical protein